MWLQSPAASWRPGGRIISTGCRYPDFRLVLDSARVYAEVKPVAEFPMDVAQRVLNSGCDADVLILGQGPRHAWRYRDGAWGSADLTV